MVLPQTSPYEPITRCFTVWNQSDYDQILKFNIFRPLNSVDPLKDLHVQNVYIFMLSPFLKTV